MSLQGKLFILLALFVLLGGIFVLYWDLQRGSKTPVIAVSKPVTEFSSLILEGPLHLTHIHSPKYELTLMGRREFLDSTFAIQKEQLLYISRKSLFLSGRVFIELSGNIVDVVTSQSSHFYSSSETWVDSLNLHCKGLSTANLDVPVRKLHIVLEDGSHVNFADSCDTLILTTSENARFSAENANIGVLILDHSGKQNITIGNAGVIEGKLRGAGDLVVYEFEELDIDTLVTGRVLIMETDSTETDGDQ